MATDVHPAGRRGVGADPGSVSPTCTDVAWSLIISLGGLVVGSIIDALTSDFTVMVIGRAFSGLASASVPLGISLLASTMPVNRRTSATALVSAMLGVGGALGLPLAGLIADNFDYHVLYWIAGSVAAGSVLLILVLVSEPPRVARKFKIDWVGIALLITGLTALVLAISEGPSWGWTNSGTLGLFGIAVLALPALWAVEKRVRSPLIDLVALTRVPIALTNFASIFVGFALFASFVGTTTYVQAPTATGYGFGSSVLVAGLCLAPSGLVMLFLASAAAKLMVRWGPARVLSGACVVMIIGLVMRIVVIDDIWQIIVGTTIIGIGSGVAYAALPSLINHHTAAAELAAANGLNSLARSLGSSLASAIGAAILVASTVAVAGSELPSLTAYRIFFGVCAAVSLIAAVIGLAIHASGRSVGD